jgi:hypothetical protein
MSKENAADFWLFLGKMADRPVKKTLAPMLPILMILY